MSPLALPDFKNQSITSVRFSDDEKWMRMYVGGSNTPNDLYTYNIEAKELHKLTNVYLVPQTVCSELHCILLIAWSIDNASSKF